MDFRPANGWDENSHQDATDFDDDKHFNQREPTERTAVES